MIENKNIGLRDIIGCFMCYFDFHAPQKHTHISPYSAYFINEISTGIIRKKGSTQYKWQSDKHGNKKNDQSIKAVHNSKKTKNIRHHYTNIRLKESLISKRGKSIENKHFIKFNRLVF